PTGATWARSCASSPCVRRPRSAPPDADLLKLLDVAEHPVVLAGLDVHEPVSLVEAAGVGVDLVDVDVHLHRAAGADLVQRSVQQDGADALVPQVRPHVELL